MAADVCLVGGLCLSSGFCALAFQIGSIWNAERLLVRGCPGKPGRKGSEGHLLLLSVGVCHLKAVLCCLTRLRMSAGSGWNSRLGMERLPDLQEECGWQLSPQSRQSCSYSGFQAVSAKANASAFRFNPPGKSGSEETSEPRTRLPDRMNGCAWGAEECSDACIFTHSAAPAGRFLPVFPPTRAAAIVTATRKETEDGGRGVQEGQSVFTVLARLYCESLAVCVQPPTGGRISPLTVFPGWVTVAADSCGLVGKQSQQPHVRTDWSGPTERR